MDPVDLTVVDLTSKSNGPAGARAASDKNAMDIGAAVTESPASPGPGPVAEAAAAADDDVDPLDAYMVGVTKEVAAIKKYDQDRMAKKETAEATANAKSKLGELLVGNDDAVYGLTHTPPVPPTVSISGLIHWLGTTASPYTQHSPTPHALSRMHVWSQVLG
jgi:hypothetical protein